MDVENNVTDRRKIRFTGSGKEYFGIWIVNIILSVITVGIYSAWAKVRRETYFKNNTRILDAGFGYHATGMQILKGRIIALLVLVLFSLVSEFSPPVTSIMVSVILLFLIPWVINKSMQFSARMTSYRNIRFNWHGTYWKTFWFFLMAPIVGLVSLGVLTPLISKAYYTYFARSHSYGTSGFSCDPNVKDFYVAFVLGVVLPSVFFLLGIAALTLAVVFYGGQPPDGTQPPDGIQPPGSFIQAALITIAAIAFIFVPLVYGSLCRNLMMKSLVLSDVASFDSEISPAKYVWINITNLVLIIMSLGFLLPWAAVRLHSYLANCSDIEITGDLDKFIDETHSEMSSFGQEFAEFEGFEFTV